tara:strand:- start:4311 stop:4760 length:450 start_codon:yes stop_codon:yes gene_type:complete
MMRFFDGFEKKELLLGTTVFYAAAFALVCMSLLLNQYKIQSKSSEFHKKSTVHTNTAANAVQYAKISSYNTALGYAFGSEVLLDENVTLEIVAYRVGLIMQNNEFDTIYYDLHCSKLVCRVEFSAKEYDKRELARLANERFNHYWSSTP